METFIKNIIIVIDQKIPAEVCVEDPNIAIHLTKGRSDKYTVTHIPTGAAIAASMQKDAAYQLAEDIIKTKIDLSEMTKQDISNKNKKYKQLAVLVLKAKGTPEEISAWDNA